MRTIGDTIKLLREERRLSQQKLADILNVARSTISMYESGSRIPEDDMKDLICDYFNVDMNYLYGKTNTRNSYREESENLSKVNNIFDDYFPLHYCTNLSAGLPTELLEAEPDAVVYVPIKFQNRKKRLHAFQVNGTSMNNVIQDGSIVLAEEVPDTVLKEGTIVVAWLDGEATVKRLYPGDNHVVLMPDSSDKGHHPITVNLEDNQLYIIGRVIWHMNPDNIADLY